MTTCRCGAWAGHPEARSCTLPDCDLRQPATLYPIAPGSPTPCAGRALPVASAAAPRRAGGGAFTACAPGGVFGMGEPDQLARDGEADWFWGVGERGAVHHAGSIAA